MNRQLPFFTYGSPLQYKKSARLTNSVNALGLRTFNSWGGINYQEILSNYPNEIKEKCWLNLSRCIIENYHSGKGTSIKGFGTFTFTNVEIVKQFLKIIFLKRIFLNMKPVMSLVKPVKQ